MTEVVDEPEVEEKVRVVATRVATEAVSQVVVHRAPLRRRRDHSRARATRSASRCSATTAWALGIWKRSALTDNVEFPEDSERARDSDRKVAVEVEDEVQDGKV